MSSYILIRANTEVQSLKKIMIFTTEWGWYSKGAHQYFKAAIKCNSNFCPQNSLKFIIMNAYVILDVALLMLVILLDFHWVNDPPVIFLCGFLLPSALEGWGDCEEWTKQLGDRRSLINHIKHSLKPTTGDKVGVLYCGAVCSDQCRYHPHAPYLLLKCFR